jgi:hypothetical protein
MADNRKDEILSRENLALIKQFVVISLPIIILPMLFLSYMVVGMVYPITIDMFFIAFAVIFLILSFGMLVYLKLKMKVILTLKVLVASLVLTILVLSSTLIFAESNAPSLIAGTGLAAMSLSTHFSDAVVDLIGLSLVYPAFLTSLFMSQRVAGKISKIIVFVVCGILLYVFSNLLLALPAFMTPFTH